MAVSNANQLARFKGSVSPFISLPCGEDFMSQFEAVPEIQPVHVLQVNIPEPWQTTRYVYMAHYNPPPPPKLHL